MSWWAGTAAVAILASVGWSRYGQFPLADLRPLWPTLRRARWSLRNPSLNGMPSETGRVSIGSHRGLSHLRGTGKPTLPGRVDERAGIHQWRTCRPEPSAARRPPSPTAPNCCCSGSPWPLSNQSMGGAAARRAFSPRVWPDSVIVESVFGRMVMAVRETPHDRQPGSAILGMGAVICQPQRVDTSGLNYDSPSCF